MYHVSNASDIINFSIGKNQGFSKKKDKPYQLDGRPTIIIIWTACFYGSIKRQGLLICHQGNRTQSFSSVGLAWGINRLTIVFINPYK